MIFYDVFLLSMKDELLFAAKQKEMVKLGYYLMQRIEQDIVD